MCSLISGLALAGALDRRAKAPVVLAHAAWAAVEEVAHIAREELASLVYMTYIGLAEAVG